MNKKSEVFEYSKLVRNKLNLGDNILTYDGILEVLINLGVQVNEGNYSYHSIKDIEDNKVEFKISYGLNKQLKKFELAHLIGHMLMHKDENEYNDNIFSRGLSYHKEKVEANLFGISLICPVGVFKTIVKDNIIGTTNIKYDITQISKEVGVTENIARNYMKELGYIVC